MNPVLRHFSDDHATAGSRFREQATDRGGRLEALPIGLDDPRGHPLTIDAAVFGASKPQRLVIVSAGLHGVEGYFGSAVLLAFLESLRRLPPDVGLILLHVLNPYGFAYVRRFDDQNIDPNRNFLLPGEAYEGSPPTYAALDPLLNPRRPPGRFDLYPPRAIATIARHGMTALRAAIAGGQYDFPRGLFFGGHEPSRTRIALETNLPRWLGDARRVIHLDLHTGIGPRGHGSLLLEPGLSPERMAWWGRHFGSDRVHQAPPVWAYTSRGTLGPWCRRRFADRRYDFATAEFGTRPALAVVAALRWENQAYHWGEPDSESTRRARQRLREAFVPSSPRWRELVVRQALEMIEHALGAAGKS